MSVKYDQDKMTKGPEPFTVTFKFEIMTRTKPNFNEFGSVERFYY